MGVDLDIARDGVTADEVRAGVDEILVGARLVTLATAGSQGPHASPVFFAADDELVLYFVSERTTRHARGLTVDGRMSGAVFLDPPVYGEQLQGVQLHGVASEVLPEGRSRALAVYRRRYPAFAKGAEMQDAFRRGDGPAALYRFVVSDLTLLDEPRLGRRVYVPATVVR